MTPAPHPYSFRKEDRALASALQRSMLHKPFCRVASITLLLILTLFVTVGSVFAAHVDPALLSPGREGSVTVTVLTSGGEIIPGGSLRLYRVADLSDDGVYTLTPGFAGCGLDLGKKFFSEDDSDLVAAFAQEHAPEHTVAEVNAQGVALFSGVTQGMVLIMQDETPEGYLPILPFLVLMPTFADGEAVWDVKCSPKPVDKEADLTVPLTVKKNVLAANGGDVPKDDVFHFALIPANADAPLPKGGADASVTNGELIVSRPGPGIVDFGEFSFSFDDLDKTYVYRLREYKGTARTYNYDESVYLLALHIYLDENGELSCGMEMTDENGRRVTEIVFVNEYGDNEVPPPPPDIPRTGQLWWPVYALVIGGVVLIVAGLLRRKHAEAEV